MEWKLPHGFQKADGPNSHCREQRLMMRDSVQTHTKQECGESEDLNHSWTEKSEMHECN